MELTIVDGNGRRKYLLPTERRRFLQAALDAPGTTATFCAVLTLCGARISEVLALTPEQIDEANNTITFETLKRRKRGAFRTLPVPRELILFLDSVHRIRKAQLDPKRANARLWAWSRTTAWRRVKAVMKIAQNPAYVSQPKSLRHALGAEAVLEGVILGMVQKWLGHADIRTTVGYTTVIGKEERSVARRVWRHLESKLRDAQHPEESRHQDER
jgi:integrase/recombinase XerD